MEHGRIIYEGKPATFFTDPKSPRPREFLIQLLH
jgi:ABC-type polar amino acid transport system ATPase subunit